MSRFFALKRGSLISLALATLLALAPAIAEARMGGGGSFGCAGLADLVGPAVHPHHARHGLALRAQRHAALGPGRGRADIAPPLAALSVAACSAVSPAACSAPASSAC